MRVRHVSLPRALRKMERAPAFAQSTTATLLGTVRTRLGGDLLRPTD